MVCLLSVLLSRWSGYTETITIKKEVELCKKCCRQKKFSMIRAICVKAISQGYDVESNDRLDALSIRWYCSKSQISSEAYARCSINHETLPWVAQSFMVRMSECCVLVYGRDTILLKSIRNTPTAMHQFVMTSADDSNSHFSRPRLKSGIRSQRTERRRRFVVVHRRVATIRAWHITPQTVRTEHLSRRPSPVRRILVTSPITFFANFRIAASRLREAHAAASRYPQILRCLELSNANVGLANAGETVGLGVSPVIC